MPQRIVTISVRASVLRITGARDAIHRPSRDEGVEIVRSFSAAAILLAVVAPTELGTLGRVDAPQADARAVDFERVAVDDGGAPDQVGGYRGADRNKKQPCGSNPVPGC
ncbi:hypothetical protein SAMN05443247_04352 [Bradyrhizobium erythrophlei]|jgi:hypothetical protein|nr:hypothetical protein SAMN05443247_04352 [Bradyrhizobium erythrophlei]